jgi:hypothetical protein
MFGDPILAVGLILLALGGSGLGGSLGRLAVARGVISRRLLPLFVGVPVVLLGLLAALYLMAPISAGHLRYLDAVGRRDFAGANLPGAHLSRVNLNNTDLSEANLTGADLSGSNLRGAYLTGAGLRGANLREADLSGELVSGVDLGMTAPEMKVVIIGGADLREADLSEANLAYADLGGADLRGANLTGADLTGADVTDEQLAQAASLEGAIMPDGTVHE